MSILPSPRGINRRKLSLIARACSDHTITDALDRLIVRGKVSALSVQRLAGRCSDHDTVDALDALAPRKA